MMNDGQTDGYHGECSMRIVASGFQLGIYIFGKRLINCLVERAPTHSAYDMPSEKKFVNGTFKTPHSRRGRRGDRQIGLQGLGRYEHLSAHASTSEKALICWILFDVAGIQVSRQGCDTFALQSFTLARRDVTGIWEQGGSSCSRPAMKKCQAQKKGWSRWTTDFSSRFCAQRIKIA